MKTHRDLLTNDLLTKYAGTDARLTELCTRATTDPEAKRLVAIRMQENWSRPLTEAERLSICAGVLDLVLALNAGGFHTCDSGDGSNWNDGMSCALPYRHAAVQLSPWQDLEAEEARLRRYLEWIGFDDEFEVARVDPADGMPDMLVVLDVRANEICQEVGYEAPSMPDDVHEDQ